MEREFQQWWEEEYPHCSLRHPERRDIFRRMWECHGPFRHVSPSSTEHLWYIDNCKILEVYTPTTGHKSGHDRNSNTLFYEHWSPSLLIKTWLHSDQEWGEVLYHSTGLKVTWKLDHNSYISMHNEQQKVRKTMRTEGDSYWIEAVSWKNDQEIAEKWWVHGPDKGHIRVIHSQNAVITEENLENHAKITKKQLKTGPKNYSEGEVETISGIFRDINSWKRQENEEIEVWERYQNDKLVWMKRKTRRNDGWEVIERENFPNENWENLVEILEKTRNESKIPDFSEENIENKSIFTRITELVTLIQIELNTFRRNEVIMQAILGKISTLSVQISPENQVLGYENTSEQLANTLELLLSIEKSLQRSGQTPIVPGNEMEEFASTLQQCFFQGLDVLAAAVQGRKTGEVVSAAGELVRSTRWMRASPPQDSSTNRLMLVSHLRKTLDMLGKLLARPD